MFLFQTLHPMRLIVAMLKSVLPIRGRCVPMPKAIEFDVERVEVVYNEAGKIVTFVIDGVAKQGRVAKGLRVFMAHESWIKVATALQEKKE